MSKNRTMINKMIVFFCTGLWHGANYTFILWGVLNGLFVSIEEKFKFFKKLNGKFVGWIYTFIVVTICFVLFRSDNISQAIEFYQHMFLDWHKGNLAVDSILHLLNPFVIVIICVCFIGIMDMKKLLKHRQFESIQYICTLILLLLCIMMLTSNHYNPFIYFRF